MGVSTLILIGFVLGWIARHCATMMCEATRAFTHKIRGLRRLELVFRDDDDRPKLGE